VERDAAPTERFSDRADDYARYRPGYPPAAIDALLADLGAPTALAAADVGAGTGISSRLLADRGVRVIAIEPNAAMRAAAAPHARVEWREGTAEATGLAAGEVDAVLAAQAFHWFDVERAVAEFQRILRPSGRLAIVWNRRSREDAFTVGYRQALDAIDAEVPAEKVVFDPAVVTSTGRFGGLRTVVVPNAQVMTMAELLGRALSASTVPKSGPAHDELVKRLRALHQEHADASGRATMLYDTEVHLWERRPT
jgi:SAM-dependent methyltransferase